MRSLLSPHDRRVPSNMILRRRERSKFTTFLSLLLWWLVLLSVKTQAFTVHPTSTSMLFCRALKLWGKGRIERVAPRDDSDEVMPTDIKEEEEEEELADQIKVPKMSLRELLLPSSNCDVNQVGPTALAYIGDVVFELMVRARHVWPSRRTSDLQRQVVALVRAEHQAKLLSLLYESSFELSPKEEQILLRGRNSASSSRNRKNAAVYQDATALEALIGYLFISDKLRCEQLLNWVYAHLDQVDE